LTDNKNESNETGERKKKPPNKPLFILLIVIAIVIGLFFGVRWIGHRLNYTSTDDAQVNADILPISFKVPGRISDIFVSAGDEVKAGEKLARIDTTDYELRVKEAEAELDVVRRNLEKARSALVLTRARTGINVLQSSSSLDQVEGNVSISSTQQEINLVKLRNDVERAGINLQRTEDVLSEVRPVEEQARTDLARAENLYAEGVISKEQWEQAGIHAETMKSRLAQAEQGRDDAAKQVEIAENNLQSAEIDSAKLGIAEQDREKANLALTLSKEQQQEEVKMAELEVERLTASVTELEAKLEMSRVALKETSIFSPVDGVVGKETSTHSEIVPSGKPVCFIIDTGSYWITANIIEKQLKNVQVGSKAKVTIDAIPGKVFEGEVKTIGGATNAKFALIPQSSPSGQFIKVAQRIPVKISLSGDLSGLKPGMSAVVSIKND